MFQRIGLLVIALLLPAASPAATVAEPPVAAGHGHRPAAPATATAASAASAPSHAPGRPSAIMTLAGLIRGNDRFASGRSTHPRQDGARRRELAGGQHPATIVLACADSRVPPEVIFDQGLGDLFVVRAAGEVLDHATVASIEYAVEHLHAPLLIVMGHHACGAVRTAMTVDPAQAGSEDLRFLVGAIRPAVAKFGPPAAGDRRLDQPVRAQVDATVAELLRRSGIVRRHVADGMLSVVPALYAIESGVVEMWDAAPAPALAAEH